MILGPHADRDIALRLAAKLAFGLVAFDLVSCAVHVGERRSDTL